MQCALYTYVSVKIHNCKRVLKLDVMCLHHVFFFIKNYADLHFVDKQLYSFAPSVGTDPTSCSMWSRTKAKNQKLISITHPSSHLIMDFLSSLQGRSVVDSAFGSCRDALLFQCAHLRVGNRYFFLCLSVEKVGGFNVNTVFSSRGTVGDDIIFTVVTSSGNT